VRTFERKTRTNETETEGIGDETRGKDRKREEKRGKESDLGQKIPPDTLYLQGFPVFA